jgi:hypothetical protein
VIATFGSATTFHTYIPLQVKNFMMKQKLAFCLALLILILQITAYDNLRNPSLSFSMQQAYAQNGSKVQGQLTVSVERASYVSGETVLVKGTVPSAKEGTALVIQVFNPTNNLYILGNPQPRADGTYSFEFLIGGQLATTGTYIVRASYSGQTAQTTFELIVPLTVRTEYPSYVPGEIVRIRGSVLEVVRGEHVIVQIFSPANTLYSVAEVRPDVSSRTFYDEIVVGGAQGVLGEYSVTAAYLGDRANTGFELAPLVVRTDRASYPLGATVTVFGRVQNIIEGVPVTIQVFNPNEALLTIAQTSVDANRSFSYSFDLIGSAAISGVYRVKATYSEHMSETFFTVSSKKATSEIRLSEEGDLLFKVEVEGRTFDVGVIGDGIQSLEFYQEEKMITLENDSAAGVIEVEIPKELLGGQFTIMADDNTIEFKKSETDTHTTLIFEKPADSTVITIQGTTVVPEFPIVLIVLASVIALMILIARVTKRGKGYIKTIYDAQT